VAGRLQVDSGAVVSRVLEYVAAAPGLSDEWQAELVRSGGRDVLRVLVASPWVSGMSLGALAGHADIEVRRRVLLRTADVELLARAVGSGSGAGSGSNMATAALANPSMPEAKLARAARAGSYQALANPSTPVEVRSSVLTREMVHRVCLLSQRRAASLRRTRCWTLLWVNPSVADGRLRIRGNFDDTLLQLLHAREQGWESLPVEQLVAVAQGYEGSEVAQVLLAGLHAHRPETLAWVTQRLRSGDPLRVSPVLLGRAALAHGAQVPVEAASAATAVGPVAPVALPASPQEWVVLERFVAEAVQSPELLVTLARLGGSWRGPLTDLLDTLPSLG
jgi:hypothetical protein